MADFYVYEHWRPDKSQCFYVGKGCKKRAYVFDRRYNSYYDRILNKLTKAGLGVEVKLVFENLSEADAFSLEKERIAFWTKEGVKLANMTLGGEGGSGIAPESLARRVEKLRGQKRSDEIRAKFSEIQKNRPPRSEETRLRMSVAAKNKPPISNETRAKLKASSKGRVLGPKSDETKAKISAAKLGKKTGPRPDSVKAKISATKKSRPKSNVALLPTHREAISNTIKEKWADPEYRRMMIDARSKRGSKRDNTICSMA